ncbi:MAG: carboxypeptidase regulatory-like domain-containing protein [Myxococcales bacterium]|nr:carboxypeptidase regulatory-like domain-containing protein [Myxococcales bacterium]
MSARRLVVSLLFAGLMPLLSSCGDDDKKEENTDKPCDVVAQTGCEESQVCEQVTGGEPKCFAPVSVKGKVFDTTTAAGIEGAHVVARDANEVAISGIAVTAADGTYELVVPSPRNADGKPITTNYTLRADAQGYLTFPKAPRVALPVDIATATGEPLVVQNAATDIGLIPLENTAGLGSVSGKVLAENPGGTLVVAGSVTATSGKDGVYTVFNVPAGNASVTGYLAGVNLKPATADVKAGETTKDVNLDVLGNATTTVSGKVSIVNPGAGKNTSIILVVEDTFVENAARGEAPPGLRAANVSGDWSIPNVPDGKYVVLGAFENDFLVRDPDTSIGGTEIQHITVPGTTTVTSFKITGALDVISPDGGQEVSGTPTFSWKDDSSEDSYTVEVYDAFGTEVWKVEGVLGPKGSKPAEALYAGPALEPGMYYQFRATSIKAGVPISRTEDLKGVFIYK